MSATWFVLCWRLTPELIAGRVVGHPLELVRSDTRKVLADLGEGLREESSGALVSATLKRQIVSFRPSWKSEEGHFPFPHDIPIPVDAVFGANSFGSRSCFIPRLDISFHYEEKDKVEELIQWFTVNTFRERGADELFRYLLAPTPWLESIQVFTRRAERQRADSDPELSRLTRVAERLPSPHRPAVPAWEREEIIQKVVQALSTGSGSLVLVGPTGSGRSTILYDAIRRVAKNKEHASFWRTTAHQIVSGSKYLGEWQLACDALILDLKACKGVLWVESLLELTRVGSTSADASVAAYWTTALARQQLRLIGELTPEELEVLRGVLPGFAALFQVLHVPEMNRTEIEAVLRTLAVASQRDQKITIELRAQHLALRLAERHLQDEAWPGRVLRLLQSAQRHARDQQHSVIDDAAVLDRFSAQTGMPAHLVDDRIVVPPQDILAALGRQIIGQPDATHALVDILTTFKAGLNDPDRPIATLLFAGPTGVGKTALARALADYLYGADARNQSERLVRVDMSEMQHPVQIERLLGSSSGEVGELVRRVRQRPFCVVLFDEIEKANPIFFDILLGMLDEGRLVDAFGRVTSFRSAVIVLTTNLGTRKGSSVGFGGSSGQSLSAIRDFFRPEFLNRIDRILTFAPISPANARDIARKELAEISQRDGLAERNLRLLYSDALVEMIVEAGFDPQYGARALQRVIEQRVVAALARHLLRWPDVRDEELIIDVEGGEIVVG